MRIYEIFKIIIVNKYIIYYFLYFYIFYCIIIVFFNYVFVIK